MSADAGPRNPSPGNQETRFQVSMTRKRLRTAAVIAVCLGLGYLWDLNTGGKFPSQTTLVVSALVTLAFEAQFYLFGVRGLGVSSSGITVERWFGTKVIRLPWNELKRVDIQHAQLRPVWIFATRGGKTIRWTQWGLDGDKRGELEKVLLSALRERGIPVGYP
jgi:hypothetical protein